MHRADRQSVSEGGRRSKVESAVEEKTWQDRVTALSDFRYRKGAVMKRKQMYKRIAAVFVSAAMLMGSMSMAYAEEPATEAATETEVISSEETSEGQTEENAASSDADTSWMTAAEDAPDVAGLECTGKLKLDYATGFDVYYYENDYALIDVHDSAQYLLVPDGQEAPDGLASDVIVLQKPLNRIYLAASSAMALFRALDSLDCIKMTGIDASGWYIQEAKDAIEEGAMQFAGKYSEPDYEMLVDEDCDVAIESTMILHTPKVQEMIENLGIPVFIDRSSYEMHPLGRTEWVKLYGAMMGKEAEAADFFDRQAEVIDEMEDFQNTEKTVAFFFVSTDGTIVVRRTEDYIPSMIELAGGRYVFQDLTGAEATSSSVSLSMEEFYAAAKDADYLVYNATIDNPISSVDELLAKNELFADFKAVKEGNVWCVGKYMYQATDIVGQLIRDFHLMLTDGDPSQMTFLTKVSD